MKPTHLPKPTAPLPPAPAPVVVEVITAGTPALRDRAARVYAVFPTIGPSDLAQICQCSKSTAWAIIRDAQAGKLDLPTIPDPDDEEPSV